MSKLKFTIGQQIKNFTILSEISIMKNGRTHWFVRCKCGNEYYILGNALNRQNRQFCCRDCVNKNQMSPKYDGVPEWYINKLKLGAKRRNKTFQITNEYIGNIFKQQNNTCPKTGRILIFSNSQNDRINTTASLDRIDNKKDYIEGNVRFVHKDYNKAKRSKTDKECIKMLKIYAKLYEDIVNYQKLNQKKNK